MGSVELAEQQLELAKLGRLETAGALEERAEGGELERGHGLEHVELADEGLEDLEHALQLVTPLEGRVGVEMAAEPVRAREGPA